MLRFYPRPITTIVIIAPFALMFRLDAQRRDRRHHRHCRAARRAVRCGGARDGSRFADTAQLD